MPWATIVPLAGLRLDHDTMHVVRLGLNMVPDSASGGMRITRVARGGSAAGAGFKTGDIIMTLGNVTLTDNSSMDQFRRRYAGGASATIPSTYRRGGEMHTAQVAIHPTVDSSVRLDPDPNASPKAARIRHGLTAGRTGQ